MQRYLTYFLTVFHLRLTIQKHITGNRVPMVTFRSDSIRLVVVVKTDTDPYYYDDVVDSLPLNIKSAVRIETIGTLLRIFSDNVEKINQIINT